jgi:hypothetical protein
MKTTELQKDRIREIIRHVVANDREWLGENFILSGDKINFWILNYSQGPRNDYNCLVRGMVVRKPTEPYTDELELISSFPFIRFFNHGESEAAPVDFSNADMIEKMDGTHVGVFFVGDVCQFHTRKMCSVDDRDLEKKITSFYGKDFAFMPTIKTYVDAVNFSKIDRDFTFVFEFIHEASYVLTKYSPEQYGLYLLSARNTATHQEFTELELNEIAVRLGVRRPTLFDTIDDLDKIQEMFDSVDLEDFEGFVFRDRGTGNRVKVKDPEYVRKHHFLDETSYKRILPRILEGEEEEVLTYFPHLLPRVTEVKKYYDLFSEKVVSKVLEWKSKGLNGRDLAIELFGERKEKNWQIRLKKLHNETTKIVPREDNHFIRNMILSFHSLAEPDIRLNVDLELRKIALGVGNNNGNPKKLITMIGLSEEVEDEINKGEV